MSVTKEGATGINATLTLLGSEVRLSPDADPEPDISGVSEAIAVSTGDDDAGLFQLDLRDPRYLPFEGRGAVSSWMLELSGPFPQFAWDQIGDVVLTLRYTALHDAALGEAVRANLKAKIDSRLIHPSHILLCHLHDSCLLTWSQTLF